MHDLIVRNAKILTADGWSLVDAAIDNGQFSTFSPNTNATETLDAKGLYLFPGGVDLHVHFNEPGRTHWEGFETGSLAAAAGANTFVVEMPLNSIPSTISEETLKTKLDAISGKSHLDFSLWGGLVPGNVSEIPALSDAGVAGFKAFMSPSGTEDFENSDFKTLKLGMKEISKTGKLLAMHAEDPHVLDTAASKVPQKVSAFDWEATRPVEAEISAVKIALELAGETGCGIHIVHVSSPEVLEIIENGKKSGIAVTCETCPHYLLLSIEDAERIGATAKCAPPLRSDQVVNSMWNALRLGLIDTLGSDHSPCPLEMKKSKSFYYAWGGVSGVQSGLPLLWEKSDEQLQTLRRIIDLSTTNPAKLIGIPNKGQIETGFDADFVLVEKAAEPQAIKSGDLHYRHQQSAYCGFPLSYEVRETWQRGRCVYRNGKPTGPPAGQFTPL